MALFSGNNLSFTVSVKDNASPALKAIKNNVSSLKSGISKIGSGVTSSFTSAGSSVTTSSQNVRSFGNAVQQTNGFLRNMISMAGKAVGLFASFSALRGIVGSMGSLTDDAFTRLDTMDLFQQKMTMITGDASNAANALEQLKASTKGTPYALDIAARSVQNFVIRGMETQKATDSVNIWMDAVSAYGKGTNEQLESVMDAIAKMRTKGTVEMRYLNRLFQAGINPVQMYATATGMAAEDVQTKLSAKEIRTEEFLNVVETAMREGTNGVLKIAGSAKNLATTWSATFANLRIAFVRGFTNVISAVDDSFKVFGDTGLKGVVKEFGVKGEAILQVIANGIKHFLPPILQGAKTAFDYWKTNYFDPLKKYFDEHLAPLSNTVQTIKQAFSVEGDIDIPSIADAVGYKNNGSLNDAFLEVVMTLENIKKIARDTWGSLNQSDIEANQGQAQPEINFDNLKNPARVLLIGIDSVLNSVRARTADIVAGIYKVWKAVKRLIVPIGSILAGITAGAVQIGTALLDIVVPPALNLLNMGLNQLANIMNFLADIIQSFVSNKLPGYIEQIVEKLESFKSWNGFKIIGEGFDAIVAKIKFARDAVQEYFGFLNGDNSIERGGNSDKEKIIKIIDNLRDVASQSKDALQPISDAITGVFSGIENIKFDKSWVNSGFTGFLDFLVSATDKIKEVIPEAIRKVSELGASLINNFGNILNFLKPVAQWIIEFASGYLIPFAWSVIRAFASVGKEVVELATKFGMFFGELAAFILPPALEALTKIFNWIADNAQFVVAGILGITAAILAFKTVATIISIIQGISSAISSVTFAVGSFIQLAAETGGIGSAIMAIINPATLIPIAIAAFIGLAAALIFFYTTSDTAREKINDFIAALWTWTSGIYTTGDQVDEGFHQMGDAINWFIDRIKDVLSWIDRLFDKLGWLRKLLKPILKGPMGSDISWITGNDLPTTDHKAEEQKEIEQGFNPLLSESPGKILEDNRAKMPDLNSNFDQWNSVIEQHNTTLNQAITQNIPTANAAVTKEINTLYSAAQNAIDANGAIDTSPITAEIDNLGNQGSAIGTELSANLSSNAQAYLDTVQQLNPDLYTSIISRLPTQGEEIGSWFSRNLDQSAQETLSATGGLDTSSYLGQINNLPFDGANLGTGLSSNLANGAQNTLSSFGSLDPSTFTALLNNLPLQGFNAGTGLGSNLASGVANTQEQVNSATTSMSGMTLEILRSMLLSSPTYQSGAGFVQLFNRGFTEQAATTYQLVAGFTNNVITQLQAGFLGAQDQMATVISSSLTSAVSSINMKVEEICNNITTNLIAAKDSAEQATSQLANAVSNNFLIAKTSTLASIQTMKEEVVQKYDELRSAVTGSLGAIEGLHTTFSTNTMKQFADDINSNLDDAVDYYTSFDKSLRDIMSGLVQFFSVSGVNLMTSLIAGMESKRAEVGDKASDIVNLLMNTFKTGLGIHSPSDFMIWVGQMMLAGLIQGLAPNQIMSFVSGIIENMRNSFKNGKFNADELVDFMGESSMDVVKYLEVIGDQTVSEAFGDGGTPAIIQEALKYVGYAPGGGNSMFGLHYGNAGAWCASFVRYCAEKVGVYFPPTDYVPSVLDWSIANGRYTQTPQPGYAAIFGGGSHIELVAGVYPDGTVDMVGGNTGMGEVKHRPRSDATSYVALDGGHSMMTLKDTIQRAYNAKYHPELLLLGGGANLSPNALNVDGSGLLNPGWFQAWQPSEQVAQWADEVANVLNMLGEPQSLIKGVLWAINGESSGNPNPADYHDVNYYNGTPSKGLMQTIPSTFAAYRHPSLPDNILDPTANIYAGLNYMRNRYGSIAGLINRKIEDGRWSGYAVGTRRVPQDMLAPIHKDEAIIPASQNPYLNSGGDYLGDLFNNILGSSDLDGLQFRDSTMGQSMTTTETNQTNNVTFNVNVSNDADGDRFIGNLETELHRIFQDGIRVGTPR